MANRQSIRVNTVLFDLDDTLLDSYTAKIHALSDTFLQANIVEKTAEQFVAELQGTSLKVGFEQLAKSQNIKEDLLVTYRRAYWLKKEYIRLYPGIRELLGVLRSRRIKLGIVTSKGRDFEIAGKHVGCVHELNQLKIGDIFSVIIGLEDVSKEKPDPEGIRLALSYLNSKPQETLFVGDSVSDIVAAHNAECWSCLTTWGTSDTNKIPRDLLPNFIVKSPDDLLALECLKRNSL